MDHQAILKRVVDWASDDENIRALVLVGSVARGGSSFDELSDLDLELYVREPSELLNCSEWYERFRQVLVVEALENLGWSYPSRLVYYDNGKIDFMIVPVSAVARGVSYDSPFTLLIDKDDMHDAFTARPQVRDQRPTQAEFLQCVQWFHAALIMWAKHLARDDLWPAKVRDWDSKLQLLKMIEWNQKANKGWDLDTSYQGRHLSNWADPKLVEKISECWAGFSRDESARALLQSLLLFDEVSTRMATALGLEPFDNSRVRQYVERLMKRICH